MVDGVVERGELSPGLTHPWKTAVPPPMNPDVLFSTLRLPPAPGPGKSVYASVRVRGAAGTVSEETVTRELLSISDTLGVPPC
jgi:hypothetical protein